MEYATQMDAARKGIYTKELLAVAEDEKIDKDELIKLVAKGQVIIPANKTILSIAEINSEYDSIILLESFII